MSFRAIGLAAGLAAIVAVVALRPVNIAGQAQSKASPSRVSRVPRAADGHPDLTGMYDLATLTPVERPAGSPAILSDEQAAALERQAAERRALGDRPVDADRSAPPIGGDGSRGAAGNVGGYNSFWIDPGSTYITVDGQKRTSIVIDPPDGRVPPLIPEAVKRNAARAPRTTSDASESSGDPGLEPPGSYDDPERRPLGERCMIGFGQTAGPPALPNYFYNNLHQIVQTPTAVLILTEMVHDARVIRIGGQHIPAHVKQWFGDSIGRWEGDTLVVDTTNFTDKTRFRGSSDKLHVIERFTRVDQNTLLYRFIVEDPTTWERPWTGEYIWPATDSRLFEYACHEANYALGNILRGARLREAEERESTSKPR